MRKRASPGIFFVDTGMELTKAMETRVQRWGNSLAVRIPKAFALEAGLSDNTRVTLSLVNGTLLIAPLPISDYSLDTLLAGVTDQNIHAAFDTGLAVGDEAW